MGKSKYSHFESEDGHRKGTLSISRSPETTLGRRSARVAGAAATLSCRAVRCRLLLPSLSPAGDFEAELAKRACEGRRGRRRGAAGGLGAAGPAAAGAGAGRSAALRAAASSRGEGSAAADFMGRRRRREVGLAFRLLVPSAGRARGGRSAGRRGRGHSGDGKRQLGGTAAAGLTPLPFPPPRPQEDGARLVRACGRSSESR